jgi:integrase
MTFAYMAGWRRSEVLTLTWRQIDFDAALIRLEIGTTNNKDARPFPFTNDLRALLEAQWTEHTMCYPDCPCVFHRDGKRIVTVSKAWRRACQAAGVAGRIPHDFRRTAVRNLVRAGVLERVVMMLTGHKTRSVFDRYHIVSEGDLREAAQRLDQAVSVSNSHTFGHTTSLFQGEGVVSH